MIFPAGREPLVAVAFMVLGASLIPAMNAFAKYLAERLSGVAGGVGAFPRPLHLDDAVLLAAAGGPSLLRTARPTAQGLRSLIFFIANVCFITALPFVDLATASAVDVHRADHRHRPRRPAPPRAGRAAALAGRRGRVRRGARHHPPRERPSSTPGRCSCSSRPRTMRSTRSGRGSSLPVDSPETLIVYTAAVGALVTTARLSVVRDGRPIRSGDLARVRGARAGRARSRTFASSRPSNAPRCRPCRADRLLRARDRGPASATSSSATSPTCGDLGGRRPHRRLGRLDRVPQPPVPPRIFPCPAGLANL